LNLILTIAVLFIEVLYYSLFMKFARKEGKLWKYLLSFSLISIILIFIKANHIYSYLFIVLLMIYSLKYIVRIRTTLYDLLFIILMLLTKGIIEHITVLIFYVMLKSSILFTTILFSIFKIIFLVILKNKLNLVYNYMLIKWKNNCFYIRYLFTIFMYSYVIISIITILFY
jgi:hypothetical protein